MIKQIAFVAIFILNLTAQQNNCECNSLMEQIFQKVRDNYVGYHLEVKNENDRSFAEWEKLFLQRAENTSLESCVKLLQEYLDYFDDGHLFAAEFPKFSSEKIDSIKKHLTANRIDLETLHSKLSDQENNKSFEGYWSDGTSFIGLIKEENKYRAYIIETVDSLAQPGEIKLEFSRSEIIEGKYYPYDYNVRYTRPWITKIGKYLHPIGGVMWKRVTADFDLGKYVSDKRAPKDASFVKIDDETALMTIPSFSTDYNKFISLILEKEHLFKESRYLIFDIRGNGGGNAIYMSFLDAYATKVKKGGQGWVIASNDNLNYYNQFVKDENSFYGELVERIEKNMGQIVDGPQYPDRKFDPYESKIEKVAILADGDCKSAAESFILHSKSASDKVITFGRPTAGVIDYTSVNMVPLECRKRKIYFGYPTGTLNKEIPDNGFNKTGIIPDVYIDSSVEDEIEYVVKYLKAK